MMVKRWPKAGDSGRFWQLAFWSPADWVSNVRALLAPGLAVACVLNGLGVWGDRFFNWWWLIWALIGLTDKLDGSLAKKLGSSMRGPTNDEQSDKICIFAVFIACIVLGLAPWYWLVIMMWRDIVVTIIRGQMRKRGDKSINSAQWLGKAKTVGQFLTVVVAMLPPFEAQLTVVWWLALASVALSLASGWRYFQLAMTSGSKDE